VMINGRPLSIARLASTVPAIVEGWYLGQETGTAIAEILFGDVNPGGKLPVSIARDVGQLPMFYNRKPTSRRGYLFDDTKPLWPFGHGLSYTTFTTSDLAVETTGDDAARVVLTVTNTGERAGKHVVQVYVATEAGPVRRPARELRAFTKVALDPGESREVTLDLDRRAFAYWDVRGGGWVVAPGTYTVQIGADALDVVAEAAVVLTGDAVVPELTMHSSVVDWFGHPVVGAECVQLLLAGMPGDLRDAGAEEQAGMLQMIGSMPMHRFVTDFGAAIPAEELDRLAKEARAARG